MIDPAPEPRRASSTGLLAAVFILLLTAAVALAWSHVKLLSQDEIFVLQTDSVASVRELIHIQRHFPISLDPLFFHLLAHGFTRLLGPTPLALRLPSILGFLLMQLCLFLATLRLADTRAALLAMAFPALTATLFYAPEARPYGLLLGLYALAFLGWQSATRATTARLGSLVLLVLSIALALNSHYFGILILIPLWLSEIVRTLHRRRLDPPVIAAIVLGMAAIVFALPFEHAAGEFRKHYYNTGAISLRAITQAYRSLFVNYTAQPLATQRLEDIALVVAAIAIIALTIVHLRRTFTVPPAELTFLVTLAALPLFGVALAVFVTHSIEVRYVLAALIAISIFFSLAVEPALRRLSPALLTAILLTAILVAGALRIRDEHVRSEQLLATLAVPPTIKAQLLALPDSRLYIQDMGHFEFASYYEPDPALRSRITLLYSRNEELRYDLHDTASLTAEHMQHFTGFAIVPYAQLKSAPGEHMLVLYHSGWDWTDEALAAGNAQLTPLGPALGGDVVLARFTP
jgi:hypothetical protein